MRNMESVIFGGILAFGMAVGQSVQAADPECSMDKWTGGATVPLGAVGSPIDSVARYSEYCGLVVTDASPGYVQSPATSDSHYFGRFFVLPQVTGGGAVDLLVAYSDTAGASPLFKVSYDGTNFIFDATAATGGSETAPALAGKWNLVEFEFNSGGDFNVWVNESWDFVNGAYLTQVTPPFSSGTGTVASVRLGAPNGMGGNTGKISYDAFEAHRTTNVGDLVAGDANASGSVSGLDLVVVKNEILKKPSIVPTYLGKGQPDCNKSGGVSGLDLVCTKNIILGK